MKKFFWYAAGIGFLVALVAGGIFYWYGFLRTEKPIERMKPDFEISADSLYAFFNADENEATTRYGGKILLLNSTLLAHEKDERGNVTLIFVDPMMGVTCTIDSAQAVKQKILIGKLANGQNITVKGRCDGMLMDVKISKCAIVD
jgi:hypothetical protein